ncbi:MAG: hypothetical protein OHK0013_29030 [Sandaracinaceae bacterium]
MWVPAARVGRCECKGLRRVGRKQRRLQSIPLLPPGHYDARATVTDDCPRVPASHPSGSPRLASRGALAPTAAAAITLGLGWVGQGYTADDAFITGRYALRLAHGLGYTFRDGPATDGVTGPLLLALEVPVAYLGLDPVAVSKLVGAIAVALAVWLTVARLGARASGGWARWIAVAACAVSGPLAVHAQSGLDTGLATLLATLAALGATARPRPRGAWVALGLVLAPWLRPELVPAMVVLGVASARRDRSLAPWLTASAFAGLGTILVFRLALFGVAVPLSVQAKPTDLGNGLGYVLGGLSVAFGLMLVPALHAVRTSRSDAVLGIAFVAHACAAVLGGGDWMPGARLLVPLAPTALALFASGLARFARTRPRRQAAGVVVLGLLGLAPQAVLTSAILEQSREVAASRAGPGRYLRDLLERESRVVALIDIGYFSYRASWDPFDLAGVTDPSVGGRPGAHCAKEITLDELLARGVDTIVIHSSVEPRVDDEGIVRHVAAHPTEERLLRDPRTPELFVVVRNTQYAERYWYLVLRRRGVTAPVP